MGRRVATACLLLSLCALPVPAGLARADAGGTPARPNVVLIMADDMGYSDIGCYGGEIRTPNLDALAAGGLRFTRFFNTARCCPTRASLMSGLYPHQAGVGHMVEDSGHEGYRGQINNRCLTIAEVLRRAGYGTYMVGKWHLTRTGAYKTPNGSWPCERGFDRFYGTLTGAGNFFDPVTLTRDNTPIQAPKKDFYYTDAISDTAANFIRGHHKERAKDPFFLYVAYTAPHWPMHALKEDIDRYRGTYRQGWEKLRQKRHARMKELGVVDPAWKLSRPHPEAPDWDALPEAKKQEMDLKMAIYAAMIDRLDQGVGRITEALRATDQWENTVILFLADNGGCAEGGPFGFERLPGGELGTASSFASYGLGWANASNTPFRLFKHWVHRGGVSTPLIVHWPAGIPREQRGRFRRQPGHLIDIMPTCVELAGADYPEEFKGQKLHPLEGKSLVPAFADRPIEREAIYWEHEGNRAVLAGEWKLVADGTKGAWELYDLKADGTETNDLAEKRPEKVEELSRLWQRYAERAHVLPLAPYFKKANKAAKFSPKATFELANGAELTGAEAPGVAGKAFTIEAEIGPRVGDGVIVAQGGVQHGFALFVSDGRLALAVRRGGRLTTVRAEGRLPDGAGAVAARLGEDGAVSLSAGGRTVASGNAGGPLTGQPIQGLRVGADPEDPVGAYDAPHAYRGDIRRVTIRLER